MKLRKELEPIERTQEFKELLKNKIENIEYLIENNMDYEKEINDFNKLIGRYYNEAFLRHIGVLWILMSL